METLVKKSALVLPTTGYELDREEMSYVDGGGSVSKMWWGTRIHFSNSEANTLGYHLGIGYGLAGVIASFLPEPIVSKALAVSFFVSATAVATAIYVCNGNNGINLDFSWFHWATLLSSPGLSGLSIATTIRKA